MRAGDLSLLLYNVFYTCNVNYNDCSIRVIFSINFPYFTKYISSYAGIMLGAFIAPIMLHNRRVPRLAAQEIITIFA